MHVIPNSFAAVALNVGELLGICNPHCAIQA